MQEELSINKEKSKTYNSHTTRTITGSCFSPNGQRLVPNNLSHKTIELIKIMKERGLSVKEKNSLFGILNSIRQVKPKFKQFLWEELKKEVITYQRKLSKQVLLAK